MARLPILEYPDPRLRIRAEPVRAFDAALDRLVDDLFETLYADRAMGLAAPQVNVHRQIIVVDVSGNGSAPEVFINPAVVARSRIAEVDESCLSLPGVQARVRRATRLRVRAQNSQGHALERDCEDLLAVCVQHEIDHLQGRLLVDHLSLFQRIRLRRRPLAGHGKAQPTLPLHP